MQTNRQWECRGDRMNIEDRIKAFNEKCYPFSIEKEVISGEYILSLGKNIGEEAYKKNFFDMYAEKLGTVGSVSGYHGYGKPKDWMEIFKKVFENTSKLRFFKYENSYGCFQCSTKNFDALEEYGYAFKKICDDDNNFNVLAEEALDEANKLVDFGDNCKIVLPDERIDCAELGYFDELEYDCWELIEKYADKFGIKIISDDPRDIRNSFDISKGVQDWILNRFEEAGVQFRYSYDEEMTETNEPTMEM